MPSGAILGIGALVVAGVIVWMTRGPDSAPSNATADLSDGSSAIAATPSDGSTMARLAEPARLLDTRVGQTTRDGQYAGTGVIVAGAVLELQISGRSGTSTETGLVALIVTATAGPDASELVVQPCGTAPGAPAGLRVAALTTETRNLLVPLDSNGKICLAATAPVDVVVDVEAFLDQQVVRPLAAPVRLVDSRVSGITADGAFAGVGVRPEVSTLRVPVSSRLDGLADAGALVLSVATITPLEPGAATVFGAEASSPTEPALSYQASVTSWSTVVVPVGASGDICVTTTGRTDLVVDLLALVPASSSALVAGSGECPGQGIFPDHRVIALYGTGRSARLGVLGEQDPSAAAARLAEIAEPWRVGDRPVLPAFELIATLATGTPEDRGVYNIRSAPEFVQEYLDVARRHGYYLILDIQPGQSDFLTEAKYYEEFLRQPDVGIALDPEWRVQPPDRPRGGFVGQVDAAEVNSVIDYVAQLVAEEGLPDKLVIVHQFQDRMITNKDQLVEQPGVALTIHMDGFGDRPNKLDSYDVVRVEPPLNMGLKLFFDEDIDLLSATEVLGGLFEPAPDLITYQ